MSKGGKGGSPPSSTAGGARGVEGCQRPAVTQNLLDHRALRRFDVAACFGIGLAVIVAAAWLPAERAARLKLLIALQYE